jgi:hypothetical protein
LYSNREKKIEKQTQTIQFFVFARMRPGFWFGEAKRKNLALCNHHNNEKQIFELCDISFFFLPPSKSKKLADQLKKSESRTCL